MSAKIYVMPRCCDIALANRLVSSGYDLRARNDGWAEAERLPESERVTSIRRENLSRKTESFDWPDGAA